MSQAGTWEEGTEHSFCSHCVPQVGKAPGVLHLRLRAAPPPPPPPLALAKVAPSPG